MITEIINSFKDLTPILWASQIAGIIGWILVTISFQFKKEKFLIVSAIAMIFFCLEQVLAGLYSNVIVTVISMIRNLLMFIYLKKKNEELPKSVLWALVGVIWVVEAILLISTKSYTNVLEYFPPVFVTLLTVLQNNKNYYVVKLGNFIHEGGFLVYYALNKLPFSTLREMVLVLSVVISVIIMLVKRKKEPQKEEVLTE